MERLAAFDVAYLLQKDGIDMEDAHSSGDDRISGKDGWLKTWDQVRGKGYKLLETGQVPEHLVAQVCKGHLAITTVHCKIEESAVEADEIGEGGWRDEMGDVQPDIVGEVGHSGRGGGGGGEESHLDQGLLS